MLRKTSNGWQLRSKDGKKNLGVFPTRSMALKREMQVRYFKNLKKRSH